MIRISGLKEQIAANIIEPSIDGYTPREQIQKIEKTIQPMLKEVLDLWTDTIVPELKENGISILEYDDLDESEKEILTDYFQKEIYPVLTPLAFDPGRPFPYISNLSLSLAILVKKPNGESHFARLKIPDIIPRLFQIDRIIQSF